MTKGKQFEKPLKPAEFAEKQLLEAILDSSFQPGHALPGERVLAQQLGVTRPTLREILQRLSKEGWVTISHGKPTRVNDYLSQGGLAVLASLARHGRHLPPELAAGLLEVRCLLMPPAAETAVVKDPGAVLALLRQVPGTDAPAMAAYDWDLQLRMVAAAGNPVLKMIFNDFTPLYQVLGTRYFSSQKTVAASLAYYKALAAAFEVGDGPAAASAVRDIMAQSRIFWQEMQ